MKGFDWEVGCLWGGGDEVLGFGGCAGSCSSSVMIAIVESLKDRGKPVT